MSRYAKVALGLMGPLFFPQMSFSQLVTVSVDNAFHRASIVFSGELAKDLYLNELLGQNERQILNEGGGKHRVHRTRKKGNLSCTQMIGAAGAATDYVCQLRATRIFVEPQASEFQMALDPFGPEGDFVVLRNKATHISKFSSELKIDTVILEGNFAEKIFTEQLAAVTSTEQITSNSRKVKKTSNAISCEKTELALEGEAVRTHFICEFTGIRFLNITRGADSITYDLGSGGMWTNNRRDRDH